MHSLQELMTDIRKDSGLCEAVESGGVVCFKKKAKKKKYCEKHASRFYKNKSFSLPVKEIKKCKFIDCENRMHAKDYCKKHYLKHVFKTKNQELKCKAIDCENKRYNQRAYCATHKTRLCNYGKLEGNGKKQGWNGNRFQKGHTPANKGKFKQAKCIVPNCEKQNSPKTKLVKGLCSKHYNRWLRYGSYNIASKKEFELKKPQSQ